MGGSSDLCVRLVQVLTMHSEAASVNIEAVSTTCETYDQY